MAGTASPPSQSKAKVFVRRTASTLFLWGVITAVFLSGRTVGMLGMFAFLSTVAIFEYFRMLRNAGVKCFPVFGILLATVYSGGLYWHIYQGGTILPLDVDAFALFLAVAVPFALQLRHHITGTDSLLAVAVTLLGFVYVPFLFNFALRVTYLAPGANEVPGLLGISGTFLLLWLLAVTKFTDMGAYIVGSMIGRNKMIPHISPGKTWEGFGGAILFSQLAACGLYALFPTHLAILTSWGHVITLGLIIAILAVIGDLAESVFKRSINAKDSGAMLPGIGGSLDLIDSVCFTAPALYFYLKWALLPTA